ncbi:MAG: DUF308 domain-containing protein [Ruminiclostridium sp.]|nr:DUF308 domain-containing protein [Ruminiclostridium sp.]
MKIMLWVLGGLMSVCGVLLAATPLMTFWETNYFFIVLLVVYGVAAILRGITKKSFDSNFLFGILSLAAGLAILFVPGLKFMTSTTIIYMLAIWFLLQGAVTLTMGLRGKKHGAETSKWMGNIVMAVLCFILGIYSLFHPVALAFSVGMLLGIYFIVSGINLVILGFQIEKKKT